MLSRPVVVAGIACTPPGPVYLAGSLGCVMDQRLPAGSSSKPVCAQVRTVVHDGCIRSVYLARMRVSRCAYIALPGLDLCRCAYLAVPGTVASISAQVCKCPMRLVFLVLCHDAVPSQDGLQTNVICHSAPICVCGMCTLPVSALQFFVEIRQDFTPALLCYIQRSD